MQVITNEQIIQKIKQGEEINANRLLLWEHNQTVVKTVLKPFCAFYEVKDLLQECYIIMQNAVNNYSLDSDYKFTTYLTNSIRWQMPRILTRLKGFCLPSNLDKPFNEYRRLLAKYGDISDKQASEMHYKTDISYHYGFNAWKYSGTSAVEKSIEECESIAERIELLLQNTKHI